MAPGSEVAGAGVESSPGIRLTESPVCSRKLGAVSGVIGRDVGRGRFSNTGHDAMQWPGVGAPAIGRPLSLTLSGCARFSKS